MKKNYLYLLLALFLLGFSGCKKAEQTEFNIDDSQYYATVEGTVMYFTGQSATDVNGKMLPATGKTVFVDVPYSYYAENTPGDKRFSTTVDANGKFKLEIPVKTTPIQTRIEIESFQGKHWEFDQFVKEGNTYIPKFIEKDVMYEFGGRCVTLAAFKPIYVENLDYSYNVIGENSEFKYLATYYVNVESAFYTIEKEDDWYFEKFQWLPLSNKDVVVKVYRDDDVYFYFSKSNGNGIATLKIPVENIKEDVYLEVSANPYRGSLTRYILADDYLSYTPVTKDGAFEAYGFNKYVILKDYQPVTEPHKLQFNFTAD